MEFLVKSDAKNGFFDFFPFQKNVYNNVLCINGSKVTALNVFTTVFNVGFSLNVHFPFLGNP